MILCYLVEEQTEEIVLPLHDAARRGNVNFLKELLRQGISGTALDAAGNTPLYWAARTGHLECAKELLSLPNPVVDAQVRGNTLDRVFNAKCICILCTILQYNVPLWSKYNSRPDS